MDWIYGQIVGFLGNFFALMGNMGVELFELEWVSAIILFFSRLAWALFAVSVVVCAFECGIEYSTGRGNLQQCGMNIIKGFLAVSLFTVVPVRLYALSVSLQGTFSAGLTGYGRSIGEVGQDIITELKEIQTLSDVVNSSHFGLGIITSPIMLLFCVILMGYAVLKVFFANLKRGGILLIQIAVGSLYMFSVPRGYLDGFMSWMRQVIGLCLTAFLQSTILIAGLMVFKDHALMGVGLMLSAGEVPRIAGSFGVDTTTKTNTAVCSFSIAVDRDFKSKNGEKETDFIDIVAWRATAEFVSKYFTKGRMAVVEGRLQIRDWTDKEGGKRRSAEVIADNVYFGDSKPKDGGEEDDIPAYTGAPDSFAVPDGFTPDFGGESGEMPF